MQNMKSFLVNPEFPFHKQIFYDYKVKIMSTSIIVDIYHHPSNAMHMYIQNEKTQQVNFQTVQYNCMAEEIRMKK